MNHLLIEKAFPHFEPELIKAIDRTGMLRTYKKGEVLVQTGQQIKNVFVILKGCVKVFRENETGAQFLLAFIKDSGAFAVSLSDDSPANYKESKVTLCAIETSQVLLITYSDKDRLAKKYDSWYKYVLNTSVMYYGFFIALVDNIAFKKLDFRIEIILHAYQRATNKNKIKLSHQELATELHCSREAVSRLLKKMEDSGKIKLSHNQIEIINI